jgi:hypothetical protein
MFTGIGLIAFCCTFGAALIGLFLGSRLTPADRTKETHRAVRDIVRILSLLSALVLGLLLADTKASFDMRSKEVEEFASDLTLLDRELMHFGQDGAAARDALRAFTIRKIALTWPSDRSAPVLHDAQTVQLLDDVQEKIRTWAPQAEAQREARKNALKLVTELKRTSRLLAVQYGGRTPRAFLIAVIFWLSILFLSFALFAPRNLPVTAALLACSISVSIAVNLIFDVERPFSGFIRVSSEPMQEALQQMKQP